MRGGLGSVLVLAACGRFGFDATATGSGDAGQDAPLPGDDGGTCLDPCAVPLQPIIVSDTFDRADGALGAPWVTSSPAFTISGNELEIDQFGFAWRPDIVGGAAQWAQITLTAPTPGQQVGVVMRSQGTTELDNQLMVAYHATSNNHVHVTSYVNDVLAGEVSYAVDAPAGTQLRAIARNGMVEVYLDNNLITMSAPDNWPDGDAPGLMGVFGYYAGVAARLDDFAAGTCGCP